MLLIRQLAMRELKAGCDGRTAPAARPERRPKTRGQPHVNNIRFNSVNQRGPRPAAVPVLARLLPLPPQPAQFLAVFGSPG